MVAHIHSFAFTGLEAVPIDVQVHMAPGVPAFQVVGLPDKAVGESRERVRSAIQSMGMALPPKRITVNLSPANLYKEGSHYDLPIALGLLVSMGVLEQSALQNFAAMGELSLDSQLLPVPGILPAAMASSSHARGIICPQSSGSEAKWAGDIRILAPTSLLDLVNHFKGNQTLVEPSLQTAPAISFARDLKEVRGQEVARRALEIAAAGRHNVLMSGPPGAGKSLLASCLPGILPPMSSQEMLETSMIASVAGKLEGGKLSNNRPFRDPHHSTSMAAMVGGSKRALPGEISLAHNGVLFLDELPEFQRPVLEALRQPLETRTISIARAQAHVTYPADFQQVAAMNPCRCGYLGDASQECSRAPLCGEDYQSRLSGPLLDRIDLHVELPAVETLAIFDAPTGEDSATVAGRVTDARERQTARFHAQRNMRTNADLQGDALTQFAMPEAKGMTMLRDATEKMQLSMRAFHRTLRVARTIADLAQSEAVLQEHIAEALSFRRMRYSS